MSITVQLNGRVDSNVPVTNTWSVFSGDGTKVSFVPDTHTIDAQAVITAAGTYTLRLTSTTVSGSLSSHDDMIVTTALNQTPIANAGADFSTLVNVAVTLSGTGTDPDNYPDANSPPNHLPHTITYSWAKFSGPGTVVFSPSSDGGVTGNVANPTVTLGTASGTPYVLRLTVSDTKAASTDDISIIATALPGTHYVSATAANPSATLGSTDVEYRVDLSLAGAPSAGAWWGDMVSATGDDIRVTDASNNPIPFDVVYCTKLSASTGKGLLVYKRSGVTTTGAAVRIWVGGSAVKLNVNDTNGQYNAYRTDCLAFFPEGGGSGTANRTRNTSNFLSVVGSPAVTTDNSGPIGSNKTTYGFGKYCYRTRGSNAYAAPVTYSAAIGTVLSGSQVAWAGGVVATNNGSIDSTKNSFYIKGVFEGAAQTIKAGEQGDFAGIIPEASTTTTVHSGWHHYSGRVASSGAERVAVSDATTNTNSTALTSFQSNHYDHLIVGARPRLSPSSASEFCTVATGISLVSLYSSGLTDAYLEYQGIMLAQATMFPTWTRT